MALEKITIRETLKGLSAGKMQTVGLMQIIPLILDDDDLENNTFASPDKIKVQTVGYGNMVFTNETQEDILLPSGISYVTKQSAQDHALSGMGFVKAKSRKEYNNAACIQQTQGGYIKNDNHEFFILPFTIREDGYEVRKQHSYSKLWDSISRFNRRMGLNTAGHLEYFLEHFKKELDEFVAEFEMVPRQIGAVVLMNGMVVGVERAPNRNYWASVWKPLIRECYGSMCIELENIYKRSNKDVPPPKTRVAIRMGRNVAKDNLGIVAQLLNAVEKANKEQDNIVKDVFNNLLDEPFQCENDESITGANIYTATNKQFIGQIVLTGESTVVYSSFVTRLGWIKDGPWQKAKQFKL